MNHRYTAAAIEVLTGLEPVRKRPGMYTQTERPNHLAHEVVDNSVDEVLAGHADLIEVCLHTDGSLSVADNGRGMPVDIHREQGISGVELLLTRLHAGGKFSSDHYRFAGGLHGVGVSVVNALSRWLHVWVKRDGGRYRMAFANGDKQSELERIGSVNRNDSGTLLRFLPDPQFFDTAAFNLPQIKRTLHAKAVLCPGLQLRLTDENNADNNAVWQYEKGLGEYLSAALEQAESVPVEPFCEQQSTADGEVHWAVAWVADGGPCVTESYVNLIPTGLGGTHVNGFRSGLTEALREFCEFHTLLPRTLKLAPEDVWKSCTYVLSVRIKEPQFSGQTKDRLSSRETAGLVQAAVKDAFSLWLNRHIEVAEKIARIVIDHAHQRQRAGRHVKRKKITTGPALPGKLADCSSDDPELTELFLVEGDSAGGSAKQARDRTFQAILPLRGKILNTWEVDSAEVLGSQEVHDIAVALGVDPGSTDLSAVRYGRVCILADADSDGAHIAALLCALFMRHFPALVENERVCVAMPPLYRIDVAKRVFYALDDGEREHILKRIEREKIPGTIAVQRFKGLGEMNPPQLRETTMNPATRRLVQLQLGHSGDTFKMMDMLLAKKRAADRKSWITRKGNQVELDG